MKPGNDFYVVAIGASAGGLEAVQLLFDNIPNNTGVAYVIIQHLSPDFKSLMPELLAKHTDMQIFTAEDNQEIQPNCIYLNQRNKNIGIKNNKFILLDKAPKDHLNLPIDILFHMLGETYKDKAIGVILSGTGSDGSRGIKTIKETGGTILVQEPSTAQFDGMPNSAILTNLPDFVLPPGDIAEKITQYTGKRLQFEKEGDIDSANEKSFKTILSEIHQFSGVNFKKYKINTLL
ncbi:MAG: chemotaxis protein CheB, partial [Bacteroidales bacterium]|nr:chemotaxis protein CheB [Bacteroidales bacterium]